MTPTVPSSMKIDTLPKEFPSTDLIDGITRIHMSTKWEHYTPAVCYQITRSETLIASDETGKIVGYAQFVLCPEKESASLNFIAVDETLQSKGVGQALMQAVCDKTHSLALKHLVWHFRGNKEKTTRFYTRFVESHKETWSFKMFQVGFYANGDPMMRVELTDKSKAEAPAPAAAGGAGST